MVPNVFMPRDWITEKWEEGYYISSIAGTPLRLGKAINGWLSHEHCRAACAGNLLSLTRVVS
jgi:hypothetical protein